MRKRVKRGESAEKANSASPEEKRLSDQREMARVRKANYDARQKGVKAAIGSPRRTGAVFFLRPEARQVLAMCRETVGSDGKKTVDSLLVEGLLIYLGSRSGWCEPLEDQYREVSNAWKQWDSFPDDLLSVHRFRSLQGAQHLQQCLASIEVDVPLPKLKRIFDEVVTDYLERLIDGALA